MFPLKGKFEIPDILSSEGTEYSPNLIKIREILSFVIKSKFLNINEQVKNTFVTLLYVLFEPYNSNNKFDLGIFDELRELINSKEFSDAYFSILDDISDLTNNDRSDTLGKNNINNKEINESIINLNKLDKIKIIFEKILVNWKINKLLQGNTEISPVELDNNNYLILDGESFEVLKKHGDVLIIKSLFTNEICFLNDIKNKLLFNNRRFKNIKLDDLLFNGFFVVNDNEYSYLVDIVNFRLIGRDELKGIKNFKNSVFLLGNVFVHYFDNIIIPIKNNGDVYFYDYTNNNLLKGRLKMDIFKDNKPIFDLNGNIYFIDYKGKNKSIINIVNGNIYGEEYNLKFISPSDYIVENGNIIIYAEDNNDNKGLLNLSNGEFIKYKGLSFDSEYKIFTCEKFDFLLFKIRKVL